MNYGQKIMLKALTKGVVPDIEREEFNDWKEARSSDDVLDALIEIGKSERGYELLGTAKVAKIDLPDRDLIANPLTPDEQRRCTDDLKVFVAEMPRWVPTKGGQLPEPGVKCLVTVLAYGSRQPIVEPYVVHRQEDGYWYCEDGDKYEDDVVAWMPLPQFYPNLNNRAEK